MLDYSLVCWQGAGDHKQPMINVDCGLAITVMEMSKTQLWSLNSANWLHINQDNAKYTGIGMTIQLDMSTERWCRKSPRSLSGTSAHPTMVTLVNIMVLNGWLTSFSFHVNQPPHCWDKAIWGSDLETPKVKVMGVVKGQGHSVSPESY